MPAKGTKPAKKGVKADKKGARASGIPANEMDVDMVLGADPITTSLPAAELADDNDDPMADPEILSESEDGEDFTHDFEAEDDSEEDDEDEQDSSFSGLEDDSDEDMTNGTSGIPLAITTTTTTAATTLVDPSVISSDAHNSNTSLHPSKPIPYTIDAGHLLIVDANPLPPLEPSTIESTLSNTARDAAQALLNHLLTTCPIITAPSGVSTGTSSSGVEMTLPPPIFALPREKRIPTPRAPTKWEAFAAKKGIGRNVKRGQEGVDQEGRLRAGKMVYDDETGEWVPKYGYKGRNKKEEEEWIVEVDDKVERKKKEGGGRGKIVPKGIPEGMDPRGMKRAERKERVKRNERLQRANDRRAREKGA